MIEVVDPIKALLANVAYAAERAFRISSLQIGRCRWQPSICGTSSSSGRLQHCPCLRRSRAGPGFLTELHVPRQRLSRGKFLATSWAPATSLSRSGSGAVAAPAAPGISGRSFSASQRSRRCCSAAVLSAGKPAAQRPWCVAAGWYTQCVASATWPCARDPLQHFQPFHHVPVLALLLQESDDVGALESLLDHLTGEQRLARRVQLGECRKFEIRRIQFGQRRGTAASSACVTPAHSRLQRAASPSSSSSVAADILQYAYHLRQSALPKAYSGAQSVVLQEFCATCSYGDVQAAGAHSCAVRAHA